MGLQDRRPLPGTPVTARIANRSNDRLGAVYSALYAFWSERYAAINANLADGTANRRDAYSIILFDDQVSVIVENDFQSSPDALLNSCLAHESRGGTDYTMALRAVQQVMDRRWSTERQASFVVKNTIAILLTNSCIPELR